jgi:hypothetical protein
MPRARGVVAVLAATLVAAGLFAQNTQLPSNPHGPLSQADACPSCHIYWTKEDGQKELVPDEFIVSIPEMCWVCHPQEKLGRSHPIGVDPLDSRPVVVVPEEIPLESGRVSCGSCHVPHGEYLSTTRIYPQQEPLVILGEGENEIRYYKTLFLRIPGDPEEGFTPLCRACHPEF